MTGFAYSFRPSAFAAPTHYVLGDDRLSWTGASAGSVAFSSVAEVKTFQKRFWGSSRAYWTCVISPDAGANIYLSAAGRRGLRAVEDRTADYIPFVKELEARIAAQGNARFVQGRATLARAEGVAGWILVRALRAIGLFDSRRSADALGFFMRTIGPWLRGHKLARAQLVASFPEKSKPEIDRILTGVWDNMGRVVAEYAHLGTVWDYDPEHPQAGRIIANAEVAARMRDLGKDKTPALMFGAHVANWELLGLAARAHGRDIVLLYRPPKIAALADEIVRLRGNGVAGLIAAGSKAPLKIRQALEHGRMVGMLVDQYDARGVEVEFFGRPCRVNDMLGRMARLFECPIYGANVVRLPDQRYDFEVTAPLTPPRDAEGKIDVAGTMQQVTSVIERWVRAHPEQWMWTHRRWR